VSNRPAKDTNLVRSFVCPRAKNHGTLENEGVVAALKKQTAALEARYSIEVEADLCDEPEASLEAK
jgi:hypothetical protein